MSESGLVIVLCINYHCLLSVKYIFHIFYKEGCDMGILFTETHPNLVSTN